jgi:hypothetical protein
VRAQFTERPPRSGVPQQVSSVRQSQKEQQ